MKQWITELSTVNLKYILLEGPNTYGLFVHDKSKNAYLYDPENQYRSKKQMFICVSYSSFAFVKAVKIACKFLTEMCAKVTYAGVHMHIGICSQITCLSMMKSLSVDRQMDHTGHSYGPHIQ